MPDVTVPVTWEEQEKLYSCGPAIAQMTLAALGVNAPVTALTWQERLWERVQALTLETRPPSAGPGTPYAPSFPTQLCERCPKKPYTCWATSPQALERVLNAEQGVASYAVGTHTTEESATTAILDTLDRHLPGIALVRGWQHWVVIDGYLHSGPDFWPVSGRNLNGVYLKNPQVAAVHYVHWRAWTNQYLSFVPCGQYANTFVVFEGRRIPTPTTRPSAPANIRIVEDSYVSSIQEPSTMITPAVAMREAERAASALLAASQRWRAALETREAQPPRLVQQLDRDEYYYIVPFLRDQRETARLIVDAMTGEFTEANAIEREGESLPAYLTPTATLQHHYGHALDLPSVQNRVLRPGTVGQHPILVWRACNQSSTPFLPFYLLTIGDRVVYFRVDGQIFDRLTHGPV